MQVTPGIFLQASSLLDQDFFAQAVVYIHQSDETGCVGFITNRIFPRKLNELAEFAGSQPVTLYDGGPVDREHLFFLHNRPELVPGGRQVAGNTWWGGNFSKAIALLNKGLIGTGDIRVCIGYCGWDKDALEAEIGEGSWRVIENRDPDFFAGNR
ncbi:YqgE/AlgH family protein [Sediminibacterium soli]|uniref:YqgE/AlgH family protein n=1 Tax=Sediminibacterium soli TaxID=2698829 RepID=UPI00137A7AF8|nr:YqgE/AlgH family protein [Sediminibacterium soli]NCI47404.1 YqgE/AlgH family protein [Sediminibacterium soli]